MATTLISAHLPPDIDPTKAQLAYGSRALPKLNAELNDGELVIRQKALMTLCDILHNPEYISKAIECSVVESLKHLLNDSDSVVRMKTTEALIIISGHAIGRQVLIDESVVKPIAKHFDDECCDVQLNSHRTIEMLSSLPPGPKALVGCDLIPVLINKLVSAKDDIKILILDTLHRCMRVNPLEALQHDAMAVYTSLLKHENSEIRARAAMDIKELSFPTEGKNSACDNGSVKLLADLLYDDEMEVRSQACAALMVITITTRGKVLAMECQIIPHLLKLLENSSSELRLNALKLITTLSETPKGRTQLLLSLDKILKLKCDKDSPAVRKAAQIAEKSITWKP